MKSDDIEYALENTQVIHAPEQNIATFGTTSFNFYLVSELMDQANAIRVRNGRIEAERPQILSPAHYARVMLEGFGGQAQQFIERLRERGLDFAVMKYGFQLRKSAIREERFRDTLGNVLDRTKAQVQNAEDPLGAVIQGVDDAWEVCLLKFTIDMIERSAGKNFGDFRKRGLL
ncbi:MAG: hypothetical protein ABI839_04360 [Verrucomicrobiota bacterium]